MSTVRQRHGQTDGRTDRRTDGWTTYDSNTALALRASRGNNTRGRLRAEPTLGRSIYSAAGAARTRTNTGQTRDTRQTRDTTYQPASQGDSTELYS